MSENITDDHFPDLFDIKDGIDKIPSYILIYIIIFGFSAVVGTFGNILVIIVTITSKQLRNNRNAFIVSLAFADFTVCFVTMPASIAGITMGRKWFNDRPILCAFTSAMCAPGCLASMLSISWIAVSRYYYIIEFPTYIRYFTSCRVSIYISSIWLISLCAHLPNHFGWGRTRYSFLLRFCSIDSEMYSYALFYCSILVSSIIVSFVFYCRMYLTLRKSTLSKSLIIGRRNRRSDKEPNAKIEELMLIKTSFKIFMLCFVTWIPFSVLVVISFVKFPPWVYLYAGLLAHCNSTLNFFVYFIENRTFRSAMAKLYSDNVLKLRRFATSGEEKIYGRTSTRTPDISLRSLR